MSSLNWKGPFSIADLLARCLDDGPERPPEDKAIYLVSGNLWSGSPTEARAPLYVGSNTGKSRRFRTRIGDLIADMHGLFVERRGNSKGTGHHSGGQRLYDWCKDKSVRPGDLYVAWAQRGGKWCGPCAEVKLVTELVGQWSNKDEAGLLNRRRPQCKDDKKRVE